MAPPYLRLWGSSPGLPQAEAEHETRILQGCAAQSRDDNGVCNLVPELRLRPQLVATTHHSSVGMLLEQRRLPMMEKCDGDVSWGKKDLLAYE